MATTHDDQPPDPRPDFDTFYRENVGGLIAFVTWLGAEPADVDDIVQGAMIAVHSRWDAIDRPWAYARTVASRLFFHDRERHARQRRAEERAVAGTASDGSDDPRPGLAGSVVFKEEMQYVLDVLRTLPDEQRLAMAWCIDGFSPTETAALTGRNADTVRSNLRHARAALAKVVMAQEASSGLGGGRRDGQ
jgi:RNA polymerase sigma-70 factor (ECF subfamily)